MGDRRVIDFALKKIRLLKSYKCVMELNSYENGLKKANQVYLYRAPGDIRIEQLGPFRKGAVLVIRTNGKIRAQAGGFLSFIKTDLNKNSSLLRGITGDSALASDWISILLEAKRMNPNIIRSASKTVRTAPMAVYEVMDILKNLPYDRVRLLLREDGPILLIERFKKLKLKNRIEWKNIQLNPVTKDTDFEL